MTSTPPKEMILTAAAMLGTGMHVGSWIAREGDVSDYVSADMFLEVARAAEAGKLHAIFFADGMTNAETGTSRPTGALDPLSILAMMAVVTKRIGLVATASTTYQQPYDVARRWGSLDHLSGGRAGWNSVTTMNPALAAQFNVADHPDHAVRYERAEEFIQVVKKLWDSWESDALVGDKADRIFARADKVHPINHVGKYYSVRGPLPFPRVPQGRPVIFQAGSSSEGREQAAKHADVVFTAQHLLANGVEFRTDIRRLAAEYGRNPDHIKVLPGISAILGATEEEAWERSNKLEEAAGVEQQLQKLAVRIGLPAEKLELDKPLPYDLLETDGYSGSVGFRRSLIDLGRSENLTVRKLLGRFGGGHQQIVGTPGQVADVMERWLQAGAADGFNMMVDIMPSGFHQITNLLVPELQRRGLFHREYKHATLRENLGLGSPSLVDAA